MNGNMAHTLTALKRWSCVDKSLPALERIRNIHVYDFDNTCKRSVHSMKRRTL